MAFRQVHIGAFSAVYVSVASSFYQISEDTTDQNNFEYNFPQAFLYATNSYVQSGPATVKLNLKFLSDDPYVSRIAQGNWIDAPYIDTPSAMYMYEVLCIHPDFNAPSSIYVPNCGSQKSLIELFSKTEVTTQDLEFTFPSLSRFDQIYYKRTVAELAAVIGAYSPV